MDFYQEKISPDGKKVQYKGRWVPLREYEEKVAVKGQEPETLKIRVTPHGPLLDQVMEGKNISVKWSYYHPENYALEALFKGERAKNWEDFTSAFSLGASPGLHIAYADAKGNIGSFVFGKIPKRPSTMFSDRILDGSSGRHEYSYLPFSKNPQSFNPESGVIVLANWRPPKSQGISGFWSPSDRYDTIKGLLDKKEKWSVEELKKIQTSTYTNTSEPILKRLVDSVVHQDLTPLEKKAVDYLKGWDQQSSIESVGATLYHQWNLENKRLLFDELPKKQRDAYCGLGSHWFSYKRLLEQQKASWWDLKSTAKKIETRDDILSLGLKKAVAFLAANHGQDPSLWNWGKIHTVEYVHPLGKIAPLNHLFNLGPYPAPGGYEQINNLSSKGCQNDFKIVSGPSTRRLIDFKTPGFSWGILPLGNSGHKLSPHYKDQQKMYLNSEYRYQLMNTSVIEKNKVSELLLVGKKRSKKSI
jgi:penicillin amidase